MRAFADSRRTRPSLARPHVQWVRAVAASAVFATAVAFLVLQTRAVPRPAAPAGNEGLPARTDTAADTLAFVPVPGAAALPRLESASIVRFELAVTELPAYGVEIVPGAARRAVEADLLIGQDGYARAIRVVTGSTP